MTDKNEPTPAMLLAAINKVFERLDGVDGAISGLRGEVTELRGEVTELRGGVTELRGEVTELRGEVAERFIELSRQNTHTAQLIAATSGDVTAVARQLIDHLNRHAA